MVTKLENQGESEVDIHLILLFTTAHATGGCWHQEIKRRENVVFLAKILKYLVHTF